MDLFVDKERSVVVEGLTTQLLSVHKISNISKEHKLENCIE